MCELVHTLEEKGGGRGAANGTILGLLECLLDCPLHRLSIRLRILRNRNGDEHSAT